MTSPLSGSNKPGEDDSWESLAEDLFGIDLHDDADDDDLPDDDGLDPVPVVRKDATSRAETETAPAAVDEVDDDDELEAGFPEEEEDEPQVVAAQADEAEAGFPEEDDFEDAGSPGKQPTPARSARPRQDVPLPSHAGKEQDTYWDALNDWDWSETPRPRKPAVPLASIAGPDEDEDDSAPSREPAASRDRESEPEREGGPRRGRRRRGRRRSSVTEPVTASDEPTPITPEEPAPLPALDDEYELAGDGDDDAFGAGLLEPNRRASRRPRSREEAPSRPPRRQPEPAPAERAERRRQPEPPVRRHTADEDDDFGDEMTEEERPRRRRRRRRRRSSEPLETAAAPAVESRSPEEVDETRTAERPRRRSRSARAEEPTESTEAARRANTTVPTWAEAIALLVHRRPKQTTGWSPEPDDDASERPSRPRPSGGRRRRRRSSS